MFYLTDSLEKVLNKDGPALGHQVKEGSALRNEVHSFQIVIAPAEKWGFEAGAQLDLDIKSDLFDSMKIFQVSHVPAGNLVGEKNDGYYIQSTNHEFPDPLIELANDRALELKNEWQSLWVEIDLNSANAHTGWHDIFIRLTPENGEQRSERYKLEVIPALLPPQEMIHTEWFHTDSFLAFYGIEVFSDAYWQAVENFVKVAADHSINTILTPIFTPPLDTEVGSERPTVQLVKISHDGENYQFDFTLLTKWAELVKGLGIQYLEFPPFFTQWGARATPKIIVKRHGEEEREFGWHVKSDDPKYADFLAAFLPELSEWILENGWEDRVFIHVSDEPNEDNLENYAHGKKLLKNHLEYVRYIDALSDYVFYEKGLVENPVAATDHIQPFLDHEVTLLWSYYCSAQNNASSNRFLAQYLHRTRIIGFQNFKADVEGFLHWGYNFYFTQLSKASVNPYEVTDCGGAFPAGDAFVVYPGPEFEAVPSIRLKVIHEAFQDTRACKLLADKIGREAVIALIDETFEELNYLTHGEILVQIRPLREKINQKIKEVQA